MRAASVVGLLALAVGLQASPVSRDPQVPWHIPLADCVLVTEDDPTGPVALALDSFVRRVRFLSEESVLMKPASLLTAQDRVGKHLIAVGRPGRNHVVRELLGDALAQDFADAPGWVREEGYRYEVRAPEGPTGMLTVVVGSPGVMGTAYGIADLETSLAAVGGHTVLVLGPDPTTEQILDDSGEMASRTGGWVSDMADYYVGGSASYVSESAAAGSVLSVLFSGTQLDVMVCKSPHTGLLAWAIDEGIAAAGEADLYSPTVDCQQRVPLARGLPDGLHVVTFRHAGRHRAEAEPYHYVNVDAVVSDGGSCRLEDDSGAIRYTGPWVGEEGTGWSGGHIHYTQAAGATAEVEFWGDSVALIYAEDPAYGIAEVEVDGTVVAELDMYRAGGRWVGRQKVLANGLDPARPHHVVIRCTGRKHPEATGSYVLLDAVQIRPVAVRQRVEKPALEGRGVYLNLADAPDRFILPIAWTPSDWERYLDQCVAARLNFITVYLWYPQLLMAENTERNRALHETILHGLRYAQARGLRFKYMLTPTTVPDSVLRDSPPEWRATNPLYSFPLLCPSVPEATARMREIYRRQMEFFHEANAFHLAFFDPGGCLCERCRQDLGRTLTDHFVQFEELAHAISPQVTVEGALWNATELAALGYPWADSFLRHMSEHYENRAAQITIFGPRPWAQKVRAAGFRTESFLYETNYETSYAFFTPQLPRLRQATRDLAPLYDSAFCHQIEAGTKFPTVFFCASWLWNPDLTVRDITDRYALWTLGAGTRETFHAVIQTLDALTFEGRNLHLAPRLFAQTRDLEQAVQSPRVRQQMSWLFTSLYGTAKLAELAATADPEDHARRLQAFYDLLRADPTFAPSVAGWIEPMGKADLWSGFLVTGNRHRGF